jgi:nicotinate phosphoribosyltransferase
MTALACDLYELTMAASYLAQGMTDEAVFSLFVRDLPPDRGYLVVGGVDGAIDAICAMQFTIDDLGYLRDLGFSSAATNRLHGVHFTGKIRAVPEGRIVTAREPILEVTAPIAEAQLVETMALNQITYQTAIATKAARAIDAAGGRIDLVDFAFRRTHGVEAATAMTRLSAMVGFRGTSNVPAARRYRLPAVGTMAHSYVEAFPTELDAFRAFAADFPERATFLVDTYDTLDGVGHAIEVIHDLGLVHNIGIRIDSGDLASLARSARRLLDAADLPQVRIFVSGGVDEHAIEELVTSGAPIDAAGVGTKTGVAADAPYLDTAYKLVIYGGRPVRKTSPGKETLPGAKQVWRPANAPYDIVTLLDETVDGAEPLLEQAVVGGRRVVERATRGAAHERFVTDLDHLPDAARRLRRPDPLRATFSPGVERLAAEADRQGSGTPRILRNGGSTMRRHSLVRKSPLAALLLAAATVAPAGTALAGTADAPAGARAASPRAQADFNGDDLPDLAVGAPGESVGTIEEAGAVNVLYSAGATGLTGTGSQLITQDTAGVGSDAETGDHFGLALAVGDFNGDGFDDLAVGVPDETVGSLPGAGAINVLYGSAGGLVGAGSQLFTQDNVGVARAAAAGDLTVGSPGESVGTVEGAGVVHTVYGVVGGSLNAGRASQMLSQDTNGVLSDPESFDSFGQALAAADFDGAGQADLVVGVPGERVDVVEAAEAVNVLPGTAAGLTGAGSQVFHQGVPGIGSDPEMGDLFGMALGVAAS